MVNFNIQNGLTMEDKIRGLYNEAVNTLEQCENSGEVNDLKVKFLGRNSELNTIKKGIKDIPPEQRKEVGQLVNELSRQLEEIIDAKLTSLHDLELNEKLSQDKIDITLPGLYTPLGKSHPLTKVTTSIIEIFTKMGYNLVSEEDSPEVETEYFNFDALNFPKNHPAKDMQDTFYTNVAPHVLLRSQTSNSQIRHMLHNKPPIRVISPGRVYRAESVSSRKNNLFHQVEGFAVHTGITFADLKGTLNEFIRQFFAKERPTRFRTSFFPFTEPSAEVDVECIICNGSGCSTCGHTGWLEILGCGMVDPNVLENVGIDSDKYTGFAFGMGVERLAMLKYAINDIRLFYNNDIRFLEQF